MRRSLLLVMLMIAALSNSISAQPSGQPFLVVTNPKNEISVVDKKFVLEAFLKKTTRWSNNEVIRPVDLERESNIRRKFSESVLKRTVPEVKNYWQQRIFAGYDVPPPELNSDSEVIKYVIKYPGTIGYISGDADVSGVKVLTVK